MFGLFPGQLDNKGVQRGCKAKTAKNLGFLCVFAPSTPGTRMKTASDESDAMKKRVSAQLSWV
jgi:hypothetical protein